MAMTGDECRAAGKARWCSGRFGERHDTYVVGRSGKRARNCKECDRMAHRQENMTPKHRYAIAVRAYQVTVRARQERIANYERDTANAST